MRYKRFDYLFSRVSVGCWLKGVFILFSNNVFVFLRMDLFAAVFICAHSKLSFCVCLIFTVLLLLRLLFHFLLYHLRCHVHKSWTNTLFAGSSLVFQKKAPNPPKKPKFSWNSFCFRNDFIEKQIQETKNQNEYLNSQSVVSIGMYWLSRKTLKFDKIFKYFSLQSKLFRQTIWFWILFRII